MGCWMMGMGWRAVGRKGRAGLGWRCVLAAWWEVSWVFGECGFLTERDGQGLVMSVGDRQMDDGDLFTAFPLVER